MTTSMVIFCAGDAPGFGPLTMIDFLNLKVRHCASTDIGGSAPLLHTRGPSDCCKKMQRRFGYLGGAAAQRMDRSRVEPH